MNRFTPPPSGPPKPVSKYRRFDWWHAKNDLPSHPRWRAIAHKTGLPVGTIVSVVYYLNSCANKAHRRGSVEDFKIFECAVTLGYDPGIVQLVYDSLVESLWIDQGCIVDWFQHNPDQHDPTAAERKRRQRQREKEEREKRGGSNVSRVTPITSRVTVTRDYRDRHAVTPVTICAENVTRDVTLDKIRDIKSSSECVSRAEPTAPVDNSDFPTRPISGMANDNGDPGADERASAPLAGALARRGQIDPNNTDPNDGLTDEAAFQRMGFDPLLPNPLKPVARKEADYKSWLANLGLNLNGKGPH